MRMFNNILRLWRRHRPGRRLPLLAALTAMTALGAIDVALPDTTAMPGAALNVSASTTDTGGLEIYSVYCAVEVDTTVATITDISVIGCITESWGDPTYNIVNPGRIIVSLWGSTVLSGAGTLFHLDLQTAGEEGDSSPLMFDFFWFNEGDPAANVTDGLFYVGPPNPWFDAVADQYAAEFDTLQFVVTAHDPLLHDLDLSATQLPPGATFIDNDDGAGNFSWITDHTSDGDYTASFVAQNAEGWTDTLWVNIHIDNTPQAPVVANPMADIVMDMNTSHITQPMTQVFDDIDSQPTYTISGNDHIQAVLNADTTWTLTPLQDWYGVETLYFTATDEADLSATDIVQVQVTGLLVIDEDFDHAGAAPAGWTVIHDGNTPEPWAIVHDSGDDYCYRVNNPLLYTPVEKLRSPAYDFSGYEDVHVSFWHDFDTVNDFYITFQYSYTGFVWSTIASYNTSTSGIVSYDISAIADGQSSLRFQWSFVAAAVGEVASWNIDDLAFTGLVSDNDPPPIIGDLAVSDYDATSVTLAWTPVSDPHFDAYEVYVSTDETVTTGDMLWSTANDPLLQDETTAGTIVTDLVFDQRYWFAVRGVDTFGNEADLSNVVDVVLAFPPTWSQPWPADPQWTASRTIEVGGLVTDDAIVDAATLQIRVDADGSGVYEPGETWAAIGGYSDSGNIEVRTMATWNVDDDGLRFELRVQDTMQSGWAYSGTDGQEGIADDWFVRIDTAPPSVVSDLAVTASTGASVSLAWSPVTEPHFGRYEIYYATHEMVTIGDCLWTDTDDPALALIATGATIVTGLDPDSLYWFAMRAVDGPGNPAALSNEAPGVPHSDVPTSANPWPQSQPTPSWSPSDTVMVGCTFTDYFGIDSTTVQVRWDANGNGTYDAGESWQDVYESARRSRLRDDRSELVVRTEVIYTVEGGNLAFELRAWDIHGYGPAYSGTDSQEGIADDWVVRIDTTPPDPIGAAVSGVITGDSVELLWLVSADLNFAGYEVYYDTLPGVTTADNVWSTDDDPNLANPGVSFTSTIVTGLQPSADYWFAVRAVDEAGNACALSPEVAATTQSSYPPLAPQNLRIECVGNDAVLTWDAVTHNTGGEPITVSHYSVYASDVADFPVTIDYRIDTTVDTTYTHEGVLVAQRIFYRVSAIEDSRRDEMPAIERLLQLVE